MSTASGRHVYGPVVSRRLGRSLGVDVIPFKTCSFDCVYCQLGRTTCRTVERDDFVPVDAVVAEVAAALATRGRPDVVTVAGSGEPTLHARIGELIAKLGRLFRPVAVLTNGSLLSHPSVREELLEADLVIPSLDAAGPETFAWVNRPHPAVEFAAMVEGLVAFRREYRGSLWLEVMLLGGVTGTPGEVAALAALAARIGPDRVQLNTVARPPAEAFAHPVPPAHMHDLARRFTPPAEVVSEPSHSVAGQAGSVDPEAVSALLRRRPCSLDEVAAALAVAPSEVIKVLAALVQAGAVETRRGNDKVFYAAGGRR